MRFNETSAGIDVTGLEVVGKASSHGPDNQIRWTELSLFYLTPEQRGRHPSRAFVAQSIGHTKVRGEKMFIRQRRAKTIEEALRLFDNSRLHDTIVEHAQAWLDSHPEAETKVKPPKVQFDGAGGLRGALLWLYPGDTTRESPDVQLGKLFQRDWGVPVRTVTHALKQESDKEGLPSWCKAFLGALQHFDRKAFHASRRP